MESDRDRAGRLSDAAIALVVPSRERLPQYAAALERGWSPNNLRDVSAEQLAAIRADAAAFVAALDPRTGGTITLNDGRVVPRLPGAVFWIWDGEFCGSISLRYVPGTDALPPYVAGHIGYAVVPWKRRRGHAARALALLLPVARESGLRRAQITCDDDNIASQRVIEANGGVLSETKPEADDPTRMKRIYWIDT